MPAPRGFPTQKDLKRSLARFCTVEPVGDDQHGLTVISRTFSMVVGTDAVEALSTVNTIVATAHLVKGGDVIRFTTGALTGTEVRVESVIDANSFLLVDELTAAPAATDQFEILRSKQPIVNADGTLPVSVSSGSIQYDFFPSGGGPLASVTVREDEDTPANNRPLPVKLMGLDDNEITFNVENNLDISLTHIAVSAINVARDYGGATVTTAANTEIVADTGAAKIELIEIFDSSGQILELRTGAGVGTHFMYIQPGGNGQVPVEIPINTRLSVQAIDADATVGYLLINFFR